MADLFHSHSRSARLDRVLSQLLGQAPELKAAAVVSFDGLPMASALPSDMDEDRVAAMSAALLSLGERASESFGRGSLSQVYVEGDEGTVFLISADDEAVLVAVGASGAKVGLLMYEVRRAAVQVAQALRADDAAAAEQFEAEAQQGDLSVLADPVAASAAAAPTSFTFGPAPTEPAAEAAPAEQFWSEPAPALHVVDPLPEQDPGTAWGTTAYSEQPIADEPVAEQTTSAAEVEPPEVLAESMLDEPEPPEAPMPGAWGSPLSASASSDPSVPGQPEHGNWTVYSPGPSDSYWS
jgi:hypothetical protein